MYMYIYIYMYRNKCVYICIYMYTHMYRLLNGSTCCLLMNNKTHQEIC